MANEHQETSEDAVKESESTVGETSGTAEESSLKEETHEPADVAG
ncbi:hypothetical protein [Leptospira andrefontaineae]|nr:hypothetical protein [Leptospira andrefontaineae]